jgi:hypothetical protein
LRRGAEVWRDPAPGPDPAARVCVRALVPVPERASAVARARSLASGATVGVLG